MDLNAQTFLVEVAPGEWVASGGNHVTRSADEAGRFGGSTAGDLALEFSEAYGDRVRLVPIWDWAQRQARGRKEGRDDA